MRARGDGESGQPLAVGELVEANQLRQLAYLASRNTQVVAAELTPR
jgi:hypothetical protein